PRSPHDRLRHHAAEGVDGHAENRSEGDGHVRDRPRDSAHLDADSEAKHIIMTTRIHGPLALAMLLALTVPAAAQQPSDTPAAPSKPAAAPATPAAPATDPP